MLPYKTNILYNVTRNLRGVSLRTNVDIPVNKSGWARNVARIGEVRNAYVLVGKSGCKKPLVIRRYRWYDNIETGFLDIG